MATKIAPIPANHPVPYKNRVLRELAPDVIERLSLKPVHLAVQQDLESPGEPIRNLYFIESGLGSMTCMLEDGSQVEVGLFGYESVIGVSAMMGTKHSLNRVFMQLEGHGYKCSLETARKEWQHGGVFQGLLLRYVQAQLTQTMQSAACNAKHDVDQRFARWLLLCADRSGCESFSISQGVFVADAGHHTPQRHACDRPLSGVGAHRPPSEPHRPEKSSIIGESRLRVLRHR